MTASIVTGVFVGEISALWSDKAHSAINKKRVTEPQEVNQLGFLADSQADLRVHGGLDKAIHHYPSDHYEAFKIEGEIGVDAAPAAFGENIASFGFVETNVFIGDMFRMGTALVQVSQGRQPCWKLNEYTGNSLMAASFQRTGRTGWYYRVIENGLVAQGDNIELIDRFQENWSVHRVTEARLTRCIGPEQAMTLSEMEVLSESWRTAFGKMAQALQR